MMVVTQVDQDLVLMDPDVVDLEEVWLPEIMVLILVVLAVQAVGIKVICEEWVHVDHPGLKVVEVDHRVECEVDHLVGHVHIKGE